MRPSEIERAGALCSLVGELQDVSPQLGKTALQKFVYLLQEGYGLDLGYDFEFHFFGPYAPEMESDLATAELVGALEIVPHPVMGYTINLAEAGNGLAALAPDHLGEDAPEVQEAVRYFGPCNARQLELLATTLYLQRRGIAGPGDIHLAVRKLKPKYSTAEVKRAQKLLSSSGLLS